MSVETTAPFRRVVGTLIRGVADGLLGGAQGIPLAGAQVTATASVKSAASGEFIVLDPVDGTTDNNARLRNATTGEDGILLLVTDDPSIGVTGWTWHFTVTAPSLTRPGQPPRVIEFDIDVPSGEGDLDLATLVPVPGNVGEDVILWRAAVEQTAANLAASEAVVATSVDAAEVVGDDLEFTRRDGSKFVAGNVRGLPGESAYQIAVSLGFVGTEAEYEASLHGQDGSNVIPTDEAIASNLGTPGTQTQRTADGRFPRVAAVTEGAAMRAAASGVGRRVAATGHSLFYGQDTSSSGTTGPTNGATQNRSSSPTTSALSSQAQFTSATAVVVVNQTFPGDQTADALTRWVSGESGDSEFFWLDTNDAKNYGGRGRGELEDSQTSANLAALAQRARGRGAAFVVIGGAPVRIGEDARKVFASAETERVVAERYGATFVDAGELLNDFAANSEYWTDGVHLVPAAYSLIGARLAGLLGPKGVHPPRVGPGRKFTWRDNLLVGGENAPVSVDPRVAGRVVRVAAGTAVSLSFDVVVPVVPMVRFRASLSSAVAGLYSHLNLNRVPVFATVGTGASEPGVVVVEGPAVVSPGPASLVVRAESGELEILSVEFLPVDSLSELAQGVSQSVGPVGGRQSRLSDNWAAVAAWRCGRALRSGASQANHRAGSFLFDVTLGQSNSGVFLANAVHEGQPFYARDGYLFLRNGADFIVRRMADGVPSDLSTTSGVFPATGMVSTSIEVSLLASGNAPVSVAGSQVFRIDPLGLSFGVPGLVAGAASGNGFAAGRISAR